MELACASDIDSKPEVSDGRQRINRPLAIAVNRLYQLIQLFEGHVLNEKEFSHRR
jgi:hypothetical protein